MTNTKAELQDLLDNELNPESDPAPFIRETDNILAVDLFPNGDKAPLIFYTRGNRRYLVEVRAWDITDSKFYGKKGLKERLATIRED